MKYKLLIIMLLSLCEGFAAKDVNFFASKHDFGTIDEGGGVVQHTFRFRNDSKKPIIVVNVETSCGCTTTNFSRKPIMPGGEGELQVEFDPLYRPGRFSKDIYMYLAGSGAPCELVISGDVTPRVLTTEERFPFTIGEQVRIETLFFNMRNIEREPIVMSSAELINLSSKDIDLKLRSRHPERFSYHYPKTVGAGETAAVNVEHRFAQPMIKGSVVRDTVDIFINSKKQSDALYIKVSVVY